MTGAGLRELKKARARRHIADAAARLFAEHGYEQVSVREVAAAAEVAEQTVYNHFATKEQLVTDQEGEVAEQLCALIRSRPAGHTAARAVRAHVLDSVAGIGRVRAAQWQGELGPLAATSPTVHRLVLELIERQADALAAAIAETSDIRTTVAHLQGAALAGVYQTIIIEAGRRSASGTSQADIARDLAAEAADQFDVLDRWFATAEGPDPGMMPLTEIHQSRSLKSTS